MPSATAVAGKRASDRRRQIVEATLRVISREGVDAVTHRAVADEAGVSLASTTYYFDSKIELVGEALELVIERSVELVRRHTQVDRPIDGAELVDRLARMSEAQIADPGVPLIAQYELMLEAGRRPHLQPLAERWNDAYLGALGELVRACGLSEQRDATELITATLEGALLSQVSQPRPHFTNTVLRPMLTRLVQGLQR